MGLSDNMTDIVLARLCGIQGTDKEILDLLEEHASVVALARLCGVEGSDSEIIQTYETLFMTAYQSISQEFPDMFENIAGEELPFE